MESSHCFCTVMSFCSGTASATGIFEEGTETVISIKAGQTIKIQAVPIGFTYELTEEITDATGTVLYKPCITTADGSVWEHTITGIIQELLYIHLHLLEQHS